MGGSVDFGSDYGTQSTERLTDDGSSLESFRLKEYVWYVQIIVDFVERKLVLENLVNISFLIGFPAL